MFKGEFFGASYHQDAASINSSSSSSNTISTALSEARKRVESQAQQLGRKLMAEQPHMAFVIQPTLSPPARHFGAALFGSAGTPANTEEKYSASLMCTAVRSLCALEHMHFTSQEWHDIVDKAAISLLGSPDDAQCTVHSAVAGAVDHLSATPSHQTDQALKSESLACYANHLLLWQRVCAFYPVAVPPNAVPPNPTTIEEEKEDEEGDLQTNGAFTVEEE